MAQSKRGQALDAQASVETEQLRARADALPARAPNGWALLPIVVFLVLYLGAGIYFEYIHPLPGRMGFYVMSVVVAFLVALAVAFLQNRGLSFDEKIRVCARGIGDESIVIMVFIFLFAGVFSGLASAAGGAESTANMLLNVVPSRYAVPGLFVIASIISLAMGTSVGTITVLAPIAVTVANDTGIDMALAIGSIVGGAMFGDNLSFISDTTIAATKTQGVEMRAKFAENSKIALPMAALTVVVLGVVTAGQPVVEVGSFEFNIVLALPYFVVLALALCGMNVFAVLGIGIILTLVSGLAVGTLGVESALEAMGTGASGMFETIIVTVLVAAIGALMEVHGGFAAILAFVHKHFHGKRGGMAGIAVLTMTLDVAAANNTVAIVMAGPIARQLSDEYGVEPRQAASILDTSSCIMQGIIPYGAQLLVAAGLSGVASVAIIPTLWYQFLLAAGVVVYICLGGFGTKDARGKRAAA
jgi:Na+/H+ antiporter NhaC